MEILDILLRNGLNINKMAEESISLPYEDTLNRRSSNRLKGSISYYLDPFFRVMLSYNFSMLNSDYTMDPRVHGNPASIVELIYLNGYENREIPIGIIRDPNRGGLLGAMEGLAIYYSAGVIIGAQLENNRVRRTPLSDASDARIFFSFADLIVRDSFWNERVEVVEGDDPVNLEVVNEGPGIGGQEIEFEVRVDDLLAREFGGADGIPIWNQDDFAGRFVRDQQARAGRFPGPRAEEALRQMEEHLANAIIDPRDPVV